MSRKERRANQAATEQKPLSYHAQLTAHILRAYADNGYYQRTVEYMNECDGKNKVGLTVTHTLDHKDLQVSYDTREKIFHLEGDLSDPLHMIKAAQQLNRQITAKKGPCQENPHAVENRKAECRLLRRFNEAKVHVPAANGFGVCYNAQNMGL